MPLVGLCRYLTAIQLTSQHLLRYLAVAVVVNKRRRNVLSDLKRVVAQEAYEYRWGRGDGGCVGSWVGTWVAQDAHKYRWVVVVGEGAGEGMGEGGRVAQSLQVA